MRVVAFAVCAICVQTTPVKQNAPKGHDLESREVCVFVLLFFAVFLVDLVHRATNQSASVSVEHKEACPSQEGLRQGGAAEENARQPLASIASSLRIEGVRVQQEDTPLSAIPPVIPQSIS